MGGAVTGAGRPVVRPGGGGSPADPAWPIHHSPLNVFNDPALGLHSFLQGWHSAHRGDPEKRGCVYCTALLMIHGTISRLKS